VHLGFRLPRLSRRQHGLTEYFAPLAAILNLPAVAWHVAASEFGQPTKLRSEHRSIRSRATISAKSQPDRRLRHTHASQLIDAGVDIVTISRRLGNAKPDITLRIYAHFFRKDDSKLSEAINAILGS